MLRARLIAGTHLAISVFISCVTSAELMGGTDASEFLGLLINVNVDSHLPQRCSGGQAAHSRADDRNRKWFAHRTLGLFGLGARSPAIARP
jgi:hypothetical protein